MSVSTPTLIDYVGWITNASIQDGKREIKRVLDNAKLNQADKTEVLQQALEYETAGSNRAALIDKIRGAITQLSYQSLGLSVAGEAEKEELVTCPTCRIPNFTRRGLQAHKCKGGTKLNPQTGLIEVVPPPAKTPAKASKAAPGYEEYAPNQFRPIPATQPKDILQAARTALERHREIIIKHEDTFASLTLGPRLQIGLAALKAYQVFVMPDPAKKGQGRRKRNQLTRELISAGGFKGWLESEVTWLKEPTAYKYMTAVRGLGLDHTAAEKQVAAALKLRLRKGPVTLKSLCDAAVEAIGPPAEPEQTLQQSEFDFLCEGLRDFRIHAESIHALKGQLQQNPELLKVATARAYSILFDLTGTHWSPSDAADGIALIDPDSITL